MAPATNGTMAVRRNGRDFHGNNGPDIGRERPNVCVRGRLIAKCNQNKSIALSPLMNSDLKKRKT